MLIETREVQTGYQENQLHHEFNHTVDEAAHRNCAGFTLRGFQDLSGKSLECSGQSCICLEPQPGLKSPHVPGIILWFCGLILPCLCLLLPNTMSRSDTVPYLPCFVRCLEYCRASLQQFVYKKLKQGQGLSILNRYLLILNRYLNCHYSQLIPNVGFNNPEPGAQCKIMRWTAVGYPRHRGQFFFH